MVTSLTETSDQTNKSFYTNVVVLLFITKLYLKKFKQFCLGELLISIFLLKIFIFTIFCSFRQMKDHFYKKNNFKITFFLHVVCEKVKLIGFCPCRGVRFNT